tara:strand:- start:458 stop:580 length:123 start_codon:yes stop_codon:yes gene_type:complete
MAHIMGGVDIALGNGTAVANNICLNAVVNSRPTMGIAFIS